MGISKEDEREEDMSGLGAIALLGRCIELISAHAGLFLALLVLIVFPTAVLDEVALVLTGFGSIFKPDLVRDMQLAVANSTESDVGVQPVMLRMTASAYLSGLVQTVFATIRYICIVYSVASILTNKTVVFADAVGAVRRLWRPAILTSLCCYLFTFVLLTIAGAITLTHSLCSNRTLLVLANWGVLLDVALLFFLSFAFQLAFVVPVLEGVSGWKALGKSWKLLQGQKWVAFKIIFLTFLLQLVVTFVIHFFLQLILLPRGVSTKFTPVFLISHTVKLFISSAYYILLFGTQTVLYFSCKSLHEESITDSAFFQTQVMRGGYEQIPRHSESYHVENAKETGSQL